jgi:hypothetical protein
MPTVPTGSRTRSRRQTTAAQVPAKSAIKATAAKPEKAPKLEKAVTPEQRRLMICEAAYFLAERRGFESGHELEDWLLAERQIDTTCAGAKPSGAQHP